MDFWGTMYLSNSKIARAYTGSCLLSIFSNIFLPRPVESTGLPLWADVDSCSSRICRMFRLRIASLCHVRSAYVCRRNRNRQTSWPIRRRHGRTRLAMIHRNHRGRSLLTGVPSYRLQSSCNWQQNCSHVWWVLHLFYTYINRRWMYVVQVSPE